MSILNDPEHLRLQEGRRVEPFGRLERMLKADPQVYSMAAAFFQGTGNADTTGNILQTLILALNTINTDSAFYLLSGSDLDLRLNAPGSTVGLGLVNDPRNATAYSPILAMTADAVLTMMSERGGVPAVALLDEAPELPLLRVQNYMATLRSLGISIVHDTGPEPDPADARWQGIQSADGAFELGASVPGPHEPGADCQILRGTYAARRSYRAQLQQFAERRQHDAADGETPYV